MSEVLEQSDLDKRDKVTVSHPDYGHVVFSGATPRQKEILAKYQELFDRVGGDKPAILLDES